jgi:hypothetical protein
LQREFFGGLEVYLRAFVLAEDAVASRSDGRLGVVEDDGAR